MKFTLRLMTSATALMAVSMPTSHAADMDIPVFVEEAPEYVPVEIGSGWYLRGDIGYTVASSGGAATYRTYDPITATYGNNTFATSSYDSDVTFGVGFGYRYNEWMRADVTLDRSTGSFDGTTVSALPCPGGIAGTTCRSEDAAAYHAYTTMLNGYVDLGTYVGFTPYVGAGVGASRVSWEGLTNNTYCVDGAAVCAGGLVGTTAHAGAGSWRFSYALMAGVAYDVTNNLKIDLGYKYRKIASGPMFQFDAGSIAAGATGIQGRDGGLEDHTVTLGVRYEIW